MMFTNLRNLNDAGLLSSIKNLASEERRITTEILHHLREIERRCLFAALGYSSLFEYCTKELGYSEGSAQRRISAMRLLKEMPELEEKINSGKLTLSVVSQAQSYFREAVKRNEALALDEKKALLEKLEMKSSREAERELLRLSPEIAIQQKENIRPLSPTHSEIKFIAGDALLKKLEKLKGLLAHKNSRFSTAELIEHLADMALKKLDPGAAIARERVPQSAKLQRTASSTLAAEPARARYIPVELKRAVWKRDHGCCQFVSSQTGKKCDSTYGIEVHHKEAFAFGGNHSFENLSLRCRAHNQLEAVQAFGIKKMEQFRRL